MTRRGAVVLGAVLAWVALPSAPAVADLDSCGCRDRSFQQERDRGAAVAVLARVTRGESTTPTFRIERVAGGGLTPGRLETVPCADVPVGEVVALARQEGESWLPACDEGIAEALNVIDGSAGATSVGPAAALVVGEYGGSSLATVDAMGRPVAFVDRPSARPSVLAACPGGRTVVTVGAGGPGYPDYNYEFAVYDVEGLRLKRSVAVGPTGFGVVAFSCADPDGELAHMLTNGHADRSGMAKLTTLTGSVWRETSVPLADVSGAVNVPGGFLVPSPDGPVLIAFDGGLRRFPKGELADRLYRLRVAPDGRTVAATTEGSYDRATGVRVPAQVLTFDLPTGRILGRWTPPTYVDGMAWHTGRLMVRQGYSDGRDGLADPGRLVVLDTALREVGELPGAAGSQFAADTDHLFFWGNARVTVGATTYSRSDDLLLASTRELVGLARGTVDGARPESVEPYRAIEPPSSDGAARAVGLMLAGAGLGATSLAAARRRVRG